MNLGEQITRDGSMYFMINPRVKSLRYAGPVAVLIDELSVSTSEITAGGLKELGRARVFGQKTPGMALPSLIIKLPNGDGFQYVVSDLKTPNGGRYEGAGVQPDVFVPRKRTDYLNAKDAVLIEAIDWLNSQNKEISK